MWTKKEGGGPDFASTLNLCNLLNNFLVYVSTFLNNFVLLSTLNLTDILCPVRYLVVFVFFNVRKPA